MDGAGDPPPRSERRRALRRPRRPDRRTRSAGQRARLPAPGGGARRGRRGRRGARARRAPRPAARGAVHHQGGDPGGRDARPQRLAPVRRPRLRRRCRARAPPARRRRHPAGQDERARVLRPLGHVQRAVGRDRQSARRHALGGRLVRRRGGGPGQRHDRAGPRLGLRRLDPLPLALLRRVRPAARARHAPVGRSPPDGQRPGAAADGHGRADGAQRRRPRARAGDHGAARAGARRPDRRGGVRGGRPAARERDVPGRRAARGRGAGRGRPRRRRVDAAGAGRGPRRL